MRVEFRKSFLKDLQRIRDAEIKKRLRHVIEQIEAAQTLSEIRGIKKLRGGKQYYRVRMGNYRLGLIVERNVVIFVRFLHRKEVYRYFP